MEGLADKTLRNQYGSEMMKQLAWFEEARAQNKPLNYMDAAVKYSELIDELYNCHGDARLNKLLATCWLKAFDNL